jgi:hypothetical protein
MKLVDLISSYSNSEEGSEVERIHLLRMIVELFNSTHLPIVFLFSRLWFYWLVSFFTIVCWFISSSLFLFSNWIYSFQFIGNTNPSHNCSMLLLLSLLVFYFTVLCYWMLFGIFCPPWPFPFPFIPLTSQPLECHSPFHSLRRHPNQCLCVQSILNRKKQ